ncbi:MAG: PQQ-dependent sugar dehydrogenase [Gammaproteobacteria bacterium]
MTDAEPAQRGKRRLPLWALWASSLILASGLSATAVYKWRSRVESVVASVKDHMPGGDARKVPVIDSSLYSLWAAEISGSFEGRDGGLATVGNTVLVATRTGAFWRVDPESGATTKLAFRVPIDIGTFVDSVQDIPGVRPNTFGVKSIAVIPGATTFRLFASYHRWDAQNSCLVDRVAGAELPYAALQAESPSADTAWTVLFDTHPCISTNVTEGTFAGMQQAGGRLVVLDDAHLLLSVGDYFNDGLNGPSMPQQLDNSYGKTILLSLDGEAPRIFSFGHRNSQGLTRAADGTLFLTEHGPQGGDELNLIKDGVDYGWPRVTYGTDYGTSEWPFSHSQGRHGGFRRPVFAWVPSVGISNLISVNSPLFPRWQGDLLVASLRGRSLFRVRVVDGHAVVVEPLRVGHRIRDIIQAPDGSIALKTDDDLIVFLRPVDKYQRSESAIDLFNGRLVANRCAGCHSFDSDVEEDGIGPTLDGVIGRPIASVDGYRYSDAMEQLEGRWTAESLRAFVRDPDAMAKGTKMQFKSDLTETDVADLVAYLATVE